MALPLLQPGERVVDPIIENAIQITPGLVIPEGTEVFNCSFSDSDYLPRLPDSIRHLNCSNNRLRSLPKLPPNLERLFCDNNNLTELTNLPNTLLDIRCSHNSITRIDLPSSLISISANNNLIKELTNIPNTMHYLDCTDNKLTNISSLRGTPLTYCYLYNNLLDKIPLLPDSLSVLSIHNNPLEPRFQAFVDQYIIDRNMNAFRTGVNTIYRSNLQARGRNTVALEQTLGHSRVRADPNANGSLKSSSKLAAELPDVALNTISGFLSGVSPQRTFPKGRELKNYSNTLRQKVNALRGGRYTRKTNGKKQKRSIKKR